jgi:hypothetical protein
MRSAARNKIHFPARIAWTGAQRSWTVTGNTPDREQKDANMPRRIPGDIAMDLRRTATRLCLTSDHDEQKQLISVLKELSNEMKPIIRFKNLPL